MAMNMTVAEYRALIGPSSSTQHVVSRRNARNRQSGSDFEGRLHRYHEELRLTGQATVYKTNPDIRVTSPGKAVIVGAGPCDYFAFLANGRVVMFDAKSRAEKAFQIGKDFAHQLAWLDTMRAYGHITGLLVWWKDHGECRWHPSDTFAKRVRLADGILLEDVSWLPAVG